MVVNLVSRRERAEPRKPAPFVVCGTLNTPFFSFSKHRGTLCSRGTCNCDKHILGSQLQQCTGQECPQHMVPVTGRLHVPASPQRNLLCRMCMPVSLDLMSPPASATSRRSTGVEGGPGLARMGIVGSRGREPQRVEGCGKKWRQAGLEHSSLPAQPPNPHTSCFGTHTALQLPGRTVHG